MEQVKQYVVADGLIDLGVKGGTFVRLEDYTALQQKLDAVLAENVALKSILEAVRGVADNSHGISGWHLNGDVAEWDEILPEINDVETPATDATLNEVRAEGVEMFAAHQRAMIGKPQKNDAATS